ncbi:hypothetical protein [Streptomyces lavendofoliae]|uniref:Uncharacterized protein n=1 Tax=Streptomyces lavendofoliae TaxID=67314 RepID=A0A918M4B5_9ACTN|nr:hypothetical protein [Streptomyces lavendofoliae]GGU36875.1 hypothetical protein GCM10010274_25450 [Streptomyces lavendofoliae]
MISEPELVGDDDGPIPRPYGAPFGDPPPGGAARAGTPADRDGGGRRFSPRPWMWALAGALVASALWAGGLYAYQAKGPDLGGYRAAEDLCADAKLAALGAEFGAPGEATQDMGESHQALDQAHCSVSFGGDEEAYSADVSYDLHKKTDPGPEFEPAETIGVWDDWDWKPVTGLGEQAFFAQDDEGFAALKVLDGQAVLSLFLSAQVAYDPDHENGTPEPTASALPGVRDLMVRDMRALMAELRR